MIVDCYLVETVLDRSYLKYVRGYDLRQHLKNYGFTAIICLVISVVLWLQDGNSFFDKLSFSLLIGFCVHSISILLLARFGVERIVIVFFVSIPVGVLLGLSLGGLANGIPLSGMFEDPSNTLVSMAIAFIAAYVFLSYYILTATREKLRQEEMRSLKNEKAMIETQLRLLQSQIEPHFLFNTLSHVVSLMSVDPARAEEMLRALSEFLRATLKRSRNESSNLSDEVRLLEDYLSILKIRMGDRLEYGIDVQVDADQIKLPALLIQPLVENAIVHGLDPKEAGGRVQVSLSRDKQDLVITVSDTGDGLGDEPAVGQGIGISNVKERLHMLYGSDFCFELTDSVRDGLTVTIRIPFKEVEK